MPLNHLLSITSRKSQLSVSFQGITIRKTKVNKLKKKRKKKKKAICFLKSAILRNKVLKVASRKKILLSIHIFKPSLTPQIRNSTSKNQFLLNIKKHNYPLSQFQRPKYYLYLKISVLKSSLMT